MAGFFFNFSSGVTYIAATANDKMHSTRMYSRISASGMAEPF